MKQNTVYTKHGKAIVADTQAELESIAKQIGGDVVLLSRRDGQDSYDELGIITMPYRFGVRNFTPDCMMYGADAEVYTIEDTADYLRALKEENALIKEAPDKIYSVTTDREVLKEVDSLREGDCMFLRFVYEKQFYDTFRREQTNWHDADVTEYQLAVVPK